MGALGVFIFCRLMLIKIHTYAWCVADKEHSIDIGLPISCGGVAVYSGDILVGDSDGVIVIPRHLATEVANETIEMERFETFVLGEVRDGASIRGIYPPTDPETLVRFEKWKTLHKRNK